MKNKITKDWTIQKLLEKYPESVDILIEYGFHCIGCALAQYETLEQGAKAHGLSSKETKKLLKELNELMQKQKSETANRE
jgi:hybrid cluster-associated redox disulfide protein